MLRANYAMLILLPALAVGYAACAGEDASEESNGTAEAQAMATTAPQIFGTFRDEGSPAGIAVLTLKKDWTFHLEEAVECVRAPCIRPEMNGLFRLEAINGTNVLTLMGASSTTTMRPEYLRYLLKGDTLYVAPMSRLTTWQPQWQALERSAVAWCEVPYDCRVQNLPPGPCAGEYYCAENACQLSCGPVTCELTNTCDDR